MKKNYYIFLIPVIIVALILFYSGYNSVLNNDASDMQVVKTNLEIKEFNAKYLNGSQARTDGTNKIHIYEVFASWCIPCKESVPEIHEFAENHPEIKLTGIAYRDVKFEIEKFQKEYGEFEEVIMSNGSVEEAFSVRAVPQTLFTRSGVILYRVFGNATKQDLEKILSLIESEESSGK